MQQRAPATPLPYSATVSGSLTQAQPNSSGSRPCRSMRGTSGPVAGRLRATLYGVPLDNGGLSMQSSDVAYATAGSPAAYRGQVIALAGPHITAVVATRKEDTPPRSSICGSAPRPARSEGRLRVHHSGGGTA